MDSDEPFRGILAKKRKERESTDDWIERCKKALKIFNDTAPTEISVSAGQSRSRDNNDEIAFAFSTSKNASGASADCLNDLSVSGIKIYFLFVKCASEYRETSVQNVITCISLHTDRTVLNLVSASNWSSG